MFKRKNNTSDKLIHPLFINRLRESNVSGKSVIKIKYQNIKDQVIIDILVSTLKDMQPGILSDYDEDNPLNVEILKTTKNYYVLQKSIGNNEADQVFRGFDLKSLKSCAIKITSNEEGCQDKACQMELKNLKKVNLLIDSIVIEKYSKDEYDCDDSSSVGKDYYFVMPLYGQNLAKFHEKKYSLKYIDKLILIYSALENLNYLHKQNIAHYDVQLCNLVFRYNENNKTVQVRLIDFGYSIDLTNEKNRTKKINRDNALFVSSILCPLLIGKPVDSKSDLQGVFKPKNGHESSIYKMLNQILSDDNYEEYDKSLSDIGKLLKYLMLKFNPNFSFDNFSPALTFKKFAGIILDKAKELIKKGEKSNARKELYFAKKFDPENKSISRLLEQISNKRKKNQGEITEMFLNPKKKFKKTPKESHKLNKMK